MSYQASSARETMASDWVNAFECGTEWLLLSEQSSIGTQYLSKASSLRKVTWEWNIFSIMSRNKGYALNGVGANDDPLERFWNIVVYGWRLLFVARQRRIFGWFHHVVVSLQRMVHSVQADIKKHYSTWFLSQLSSSSNVNDAISENETGAT